MAARPSAPGPFVVMWFALQADVLSWNALLGARLPDVVTRNALRAGRRDAARVDHGPVP